MKKGEILKLCAVTAIAAIFSYVIAGALFNSSQKRSTKVPSIEAITPNLPDIKNEAAYQSFLNPNALDITLPIEIGGSTNTNPFQ